MYKLRLLLKKIHTPITIMLVPHSRFSTRSVRIPLFAAAAFCAIVCMGAVFTVSLTAQAVEVFGDIYAQRLTVADGGVFEGRSYMQKNSETSRKLEHKPLDV